jgi:hypothetical protein
LEWLKVIKAVNRGAELEKRIKNKEKRLFSGGWKLDAGS